MSLTMARNCSRASAKAVGVAVTFATLAGLAAARAHAVVLGVVLDLGQPQRFEYRRHVHAEASAQPLLQAVEPLDGIVGRAAPGLHRAFCRGLLLVGAAERHPVAVLFQQR